MTQECGGIFIFLTNKIFRFCWSAWTLGMYGKPFFEPLVFPRNPQPPQNTDSHPCIRPGWSRSLSEWPRSAYYRWNLPDPSKTVCGNLEATSKEQSFVTR